MLGSISVGSVTPALPVQNSIAPAQSQAAPSSPSGQNAPTSTPGSAPDAGQDLLKSTYLPSNSPAGGTYKVVEKNTGQVVVELPREIVLSPGSSDGAPQAPAGVDLKA